MAARNRNRQNLATTGVDEEYILWSQVQADARKVDSILTLHSQKWERMNSLKDEIEDQWNRNQKPSAEAEDELMRLCRENIKHVEESIALIEGSDTNGPTLLGSLNILQALRRSSEADALLSHASTPTRNGGGPSSYKVGNRKRKAHQLNSTTVNNTDSSNNNTIHSLATTQSNSNPLAADSSSVISADDDYKDTSLNSIASSSAIAASAPKVVISNPSGRLKIASTSRAGSAAPLSARENSIKIEDGLESGTDILTSRDAKPQVLLKSQLVRGAEVFYRSKKQSHRSSNTTAAATSISATASASASAASMNGDDGEGILCKVMGFSKEGKQRRYEIIDVDLEDSVTPYQARQSQLVPIPSTNDGLSDLSLRKTVLAVYPTTTTFYRAEVVAVKGKDVPARHVKLKFEDEDEKNKESVVERRYVLTEWPGRY